MKRILLLAVFALSISISFASAQSDDTVNLTVDVNGVPNITAIDLRDADGGTIQIGRAHV